MGVAPAELHVSDLPGSKAGGAKTGAGAGGGVGGLAGVLVCLGTGPLFPLCALALVPAGAAAGAGTGAVVGVVATRSTMAIDDKTAALKAEFVSPSHQTLLAEQLRDRLRSEQALEIPLESSVSDSLVSVASHPADVDAPLVLQVNLTEIGTEGRRAFALRLVAELVLRRGSSVVWQTAREVQSDTELTLDQWTKSDSKALRGVIDACVRTAARSLVVELARGIAGSRESLARAGKRYSSSCDDRPGDWLQAELQP